MRAINCSKAPLCHLNIENGGRLMSKRMLTFEKTIETKISVDVDISVEVVLAMEEAGWFLIEVDGQPGDIDTLDPPCEP